MSLTLTAAMASALGRTVYEPGVFIELGFTTPVRLHDRQGTKSWNALSWAAADVNVSGLEFNNGVAQRCSLAIVDSDNAIAQKCRSEGVGKSARIWLFDNSALASNDPELLFDGIMAAPSGGDSRRLQIQCAVSTRMLPVGMLAQLLPAYMFIQEGREIAFGHGKVIAARRGEYA